MIIGWGGPDLSNDGYFPIIAMPLSGGGQYQVISRGERGYHAGASSLSNVVYSRYFPSVYTTELLTLDVTQSTSSRTTELWRGRTQLIFERPDYPNFSVDGSRMVFVGTDFNTGTRSVYLYDANATGDPIKQLTSDGRTYEFPSLSPDGRMVIAVRVETNQSPPGRDLMYINTETLAMQPLTSDGSNTLETMPRWSPDGQIIAYAVTSNDGRYDLFIRTADGAGGALNITNHPADDIYPVFSPDSRHLAFSSNRQGNYNLYIYDLLDSRMYQLTTTTDNFFAGAWLP
jgi:Tol biopolymer transport system component